jgi:hypothetical protein
MNDGHIMKDRNVKQAMLRKEQRRVNMVDVFFTCMNVEH